MPSTPAMTTWEGEEEGSVVSLIAPVAPQKTIHPPFFFSALTGTIDFITSSGRITPMDAMPTPDLAVP